VGQVPRFTELGLQWRDCHYNEKRVHRRASTKGLEIAVNSSYSIEEISGLPEYQNKYGTGTGFVYGQVKRIVGCAIPRRSWHIQQLPLIPLWTDIAAAYPDTPPTVPYQAYPNNVKDFFNHGTMWD
jgi:hypothetical protein